MGSPPIEFRLVVVVKLHSLKLHSLSVRTYQRCAMNEDKFVPECNLTKSQLPTTSYLYMTNVI